LYFDKVVTRFFFEFVGATSSKKNGAVAMHPCLTLRSALHHADSEKKTESTWLGLLPVGQHHCAALVRKILPLFYSLGLY